MMLRILTLPFLSLLLVACSAKSVSVQTPADHPANPAAAEVAFAAAPNVLAEDATITPPQSEGERESGHEGHQGQKHGADVGKDEVAATLVPHDYPLTTCPVTGEKLGSMGKPVLAEHDGNQVWLCCKGCLKDFNKDPQAFIAKLDAAKQAQPHDRDHAQKATDTKGKVGHDARENHKAPDQTAQVSATTQQLVDKLASAYLSLTDLLAAEVKS